MTGKNEARVRFDIDSKGILDQIVLSAQDMNTPPNTPDARRRRLELCMVYHVHSGNENGHDD